MEGGLTACRPEGVNPTWGPREEEECKTPAKTDGNCGLHRAERTVWVCPPPRVPLVAPSTCTAPCRPSYILASLWYGSQRISLLILLISTSPLPSHNDVLPTQPPGGEPPSAQPLSSPVLGFSSFSLVLEQIKTRWTVSPRTQIMP